MKPRLVAAFSAFLALTCSVVGPSEPAWAAVPSGQEIAGTIASAKVLPPGYQVTASCSADGQFTVSTYRNPKAQDKDLKIDAVLITKVLFDKYADVLKSVAVKFHDPSRPAMFKLITVPEGLIKRFASGELSQQALMDVIAITAGGAAGSSTYGGRASISEVVGYKVVDGYKYEERMQLYLRIRKLARFDMDVSKVFNDLRNMDQRVRNGATEEIVTSFNGIQTAVGKLEVAYTERVNAQTSQEQMNRAELTNRQTLAAFRPHFGVGYRRRCSMVSQIQAIASSGRDITWYMKAFEDIENSLTGDPELTKVKIMQLERQLGIPASQNW